MDWLKRVFPSLYKSTVVNQPGALIDTRPAVLKQDDVHFGEIVASADAVQWAIKVVSKWRKFPIGNQNGSGSCVAFTMAKILGILRFLKDGVFVQFSPAHIYVRRTNKGQAGMIGIDAFAIAAQGVTLEVLAPSQNLTEEQMDATKLPGYAEEVASLFQLGDPTPIFLPVKDIDAVASVIQKTGKAVMVWFYFTYPEWNDMPTLQASLTNEGDANALRHSVTAVDFTLLSDGRKALIIEDQWGVFGAYNGQRVITEDFFKTRNWFAAYPMNLKRIQVSDAPALPKYTFGKNLEFIPWDTAKDAPSNPGLDATQRGDVIALQTVLQTLTDINGNAYFPVNVKPTGYYGALTKDAVYRFQTEHKVAAQSILDASGGRYFYESSRAAMNALLNQ